MRRRAGRDGCSGVMIPGKDAETLCEEEEGPGASKNGKDVDPPASPCKTSEGRFCRWAAGNSATCIDGDAHDPPKQVGHLVFLGGYMERARAQARDVEGELCAAVHVRLDGMSLHREIEVGLGRDNEAWRVREEVPCRTGVRRA